MFLFLMKVNNSSWKLGDVLCDAWVACDVMCCTASILNLTAISVDRYVIWLLLATDIPDSRQFTFVELCVDELKCFTTE